MEQTESLKPKYYGNLYGHGASYGGAVYDPKGISPTVMDCFCRGGGMILVKYGKETNMPKQ